MLVNAARIAADFRAIAAFTQTPGNGRSCPTFSPEWGQACGYVRDQLAACGCQTRIDAAGNLHVRPRGLAWDSPAWLSGSHLDSVPNGGDYDGVAGVVVPLEILRAAHDAGRGDLPLELIIFADEEGTTFGTGMLGSLAWVGKMSAADLGRYRNAAGETYLAAGAAHGVCPNDLPHEQINPAHYRGLIEVHIEQGPRMWNRGERVAVVTAIAGRRQ